MAAAAFMVSCSQGADETAAGQRSVVFSVNVDSATRAAVNYGAESYFTLGEGFGQATVTDSYESFTYNYEDGLLKAATDLDIISFPLGGDPLPGLYISWPSEAVRKAHTDVHGAKVVRDQSDRKDFLGMDWLSCMILNVKPTTVVPISLEHLYSKITFTLGGIHAGKKIEQLEVGDFKAYCDPAGNDAQLIYNEVGDKGSLPLATPGKVWVAGVADPVLFQLADSPDDHLTDAGDHYTIVIEVEE